MRTIVAAISAVFSAGIGCLAVSVSLISIGWFNAAVFFGRPYSVRFDWTAQTNLLDWATQLFVLVFHLAFALMGVKLVVDAGQKILPLSPMRSSAQKASSLIESSNFDINPQQVETAQHAAVR